MLHTTKYITVSFLFNEPVFPQLSYFLSEKKPKALHILTQTSGMVHHTDWPQMKGETAE